MRVDDFYPVPILDLDNEVASALINLHALLKANDHKIGTFIRKLSPEKFKSYSNIMSSLGEVSHISKADDKNIQKTSMKLPTSSMAAFFRHVESKNPEIDKEQSMKCVYGCTYLSSQHIPAACFIILRRSVQIVEPLVLLYHFLKIILKLSSDSKRFALVVDCSLFNKNNFLLNKSANFWKKFFAVLDSDVVHSISSIYILYPSSESMKVGTILYDGIHERFPLQVMDDILSKLVFVSPHSMGSFDSNLLKSLPQFTQNIQRGLEIRWPATIMSKPISVGFSERICSVEQNETISVGVENGMAPIQFLKVDMMFLGAITNVSIESKSTAVISMNTVSVDDQDGLIDLTEFNVRFVLSNAYIGLKIIYMYFLFRTKVANLTEV